MRQKIGMIFFSIFLIASTLFLSGYDYVNNIQLIADKFTVELGSNLNDNLSSYITGSIDKATIDLSDVNVNKIGDYKASINNEGQILTFIIQVRDTIAPSVDIKNNLIYKVNQKVLAKDLVTNIVDKSKVKIKFADGKENKKYSKSGLITEKILVEDESLNRVEYNAIFKVVKDNVKPKLNGIKNKSIYIGDKLNYLSNLTAKDNIDGNITKKIKIVKKANLIKAGHYIVVYSVQDSSGNKTIAKMKLTVKKDRAPVIKGVKNKTVYLNSSVNYLSGVKAYDDRDGNITNKIRVDKSRVNLSKVGKYKVIYSVTDSRGHKSTKIIQITVKEFSFSNVKPSGGKDVDGDSKASGEQVGTWD
ncbi:immunoglobulin-like domain-containing protein [Anaeromicropila herbilytica]|uniref:Pesticidal crystal protein Cry22Aa Ig-like domain-containing protein n=1 Tax=Anaeromicropila herbilytica TaxID=2785025 RepID=A0A7R7IBD9_9FIRM|nr:immunoglobulin-like domain-containing protein [Anaeromicropila herbilytica]BCN29538.1 hypothetical protein bsdtb5_08330 [Anaeromicropila herbilytica]